MSTLDRTKPAYVATQCTHPDGKRGSYLYQGNVREPSGTSPRFADLGACFAWCKANNWQEQPGCYRYEAKESES